MDWRNWNIFKTLKMLVIIIEVFLSHEQRSVHLERSSSFLWRQQLVFVRWLIIGYLVVTPRTACTPIQLKASKAGKKSVNLHCLYWCCYSLLCPFTFSVLHTTSDAQRHVLPTFCFSFNNQVKHWIFFFFLFLFSFSCGFVFGSLLSDDPVGGHFFESLKLLHSCNYYNTNQVYLAHNVCTVYSRAYWTCTEWQRLIYQHINTVTCNIAQYVCNY